MRHAIILALGFALGVACSLADELEGAACRTADDCDKSQTCVRTLHQEVEGIGSCSSSATCVPGEQVGCECADQACPGSGLVSVEHPGLDDPNTNAPLCFCCPSATECGMGQEVVITAVANGTARCLCCPVCDNVEQQVRMLDDDGNVLECDCEDPVDSTGSTTQG